MTEDNLATLLDRTCQDAGQLQGIEFHLPASWGAQVPGRWEAGYRLRQQGHSTVTLSYWFSLSSRLSEEVILPWSFPPTAEQSENLKRDIAASIAQMQEWLSK